MKLNRFDEVVPRGYARVALQCCDNGSWRSPVQQMRSALANAKRAPKSGWIYASAFFEFTPPYISFNPPG
ncbi:hypothetical protein F4Z99_04075 [Candidatus Poribacteria bacterium]|nr:hypothetical protein [Candidatus Poribacteria bacterium]